MLRHCLNAKIVVQRNGSTIISTLSPVYYLHAKTLLGCKDRRSEKWFNNYFHFDNQLVVERYFLNV